MRVLGDQEKILKIGKILNIIIGGTLLMGAWQYLEAAGTSAALRLLSGQIQAKTKDVQNIDKSKTSSNIQVSARANSSAANKLFASRLAWAAQAHDVLLEKLTAAGTPTLPTPQPGSGAVSYFASRPVELTLLGLSRNVYQTLDDLRGTDATFQFQSIDFTKVADAKSAGITRATVHVLVYARVD